MIGQFSGLYSTVRPAKIYLMAVFVAKMFCDLSPSVILTFIASKSLKLSFTLNCVLKCAKDLFCFDMLQKYEGIPRE